METTRIPVPGPSTFVDCPWCDAAVELEADADELACPACLVHVELEPAVRHAALLAA